MTAVSNGLLAGRHALITGGARGIGRAIAVKLMEHGARVTLLGRDARRLQEAAQELPGDVGVVAADVTDRGQIRDAFARARDRHGEVELLVNNAGAATSAPLHKVDEAHWQNMLAVNLTGTFHCIQAALPSMIAAESGRIVNVASTAGLVGYPYVAAYCAAKHGVIGMTRALALELAPENITVVGISPGPFLTEMNLPITENPEQNAQFLSIFALGQWGQVQDIGSLAAFLCSDAAKFITGSDILIDGGWCAR